MRIGGIIDISTKDIPTRSAMVLFTIGCNLNCQFCHNKSLLDYNAGKEMELNEIVRKVKDNNLVTGISISGGEPTLQHDILQLCKLIKSTGKFVSIDTNGTKPEVIKRILPYIDRIALDLKTPFNKERLNQITRSLIDPNLIIKTIEILNKQKNIIFEIRTTYVENLIIPDDIHQIIAFLRNIDFRGTFVLQQYQHSEGIGEKYKEKFQKPEHISLINILKPYNKLELPFKIFLRDDMVGYALLENIMEKLG
jgi:pyruvate formate lyase activating enzyme